MGKQITEYMRFQRIYSRMIAEKKKNYASERAVLVKEKKEKKENSNA